MSKVVVIGANHAGNACINQILANSDNEVIVFEKNSKITFLGCGMALWIGEQIHSDEKLFYSNKDNLERAGATVYLNTIVTQIDITKKEVHARTKDNEEIIQAYDKLVLATGSKPIIPSIPGIELENIQLVKEYQHALDVISKLQDETIKNISVIGGGYIGVELAEAFKRHGKNVTLIDVAPKTLSSYYDPEFSKLMDMNLVDNGIVLRLSEKVVEFIGEDKLEKIKTNKGLIDADMAVVCVGFKPNTFDIAAKRFINGAYKVNRKQETSIKDVYAIGDCATVFDNSINDTNYIALATSAIRSGIVCGQNICGIETISPGTQGSNAISIFGFNMVSTGLSLKNAQKHNIDCLSVDYMDFQKAVFMECSNPKVNIRIVYEKSSRRIIGAQLASFYDMSMGIHMFSLAIQKHVTIDELKLLDIFFLPHFNQPYNYINMCALKAK